MKDDKPPSVAEVIVVAAFCAGMIMLGILLVVSLHRSPL